MADLLRAWLLAQRQEVPGGSAAALAIDYSHGRWQALTRYLDDGAVPIDNNQNLIRPIALGTAQGFTAETNTLRDAHGRRSP